MIYSWGTGGRVSKLCSREVKVQGIEWQMLWAVRPHALRSICMQLCLCFPEVLQFEGVEGTGPGKSLPKPSFHCFGSIVASSLLCYFPANPRLLFKMSLALSLLSVGCQVYQAGQVDRSRQTGASQTLGWAPHTLPVTGLRQASHQGATADIWVGGVLCNCGVGKAFLN